MLRFAPFCELNAKTMTPERARELSKVLEQVRRHNCIYGSDAIMCDCKYTISFDDAKIGEGEHSGCPELAEAAFFFKYWADNIQVGMTNKNYLKGVRAEREVLKLFSGDGIWGFRSAGSHSPVDLVVVDTKTKSINLIQVKNIKSAKGFLKLLDELSKSFVSDSPLRYYQVSHSVWVKYKGKWLSKGRRV